MHGPDFAAHVDEMESASRQLADRHRVACMHGRPGAWRRVFDLMKVSGVEMLHRSLLNLLQSDAPPSTGGRLLAQNAASHNNLLPCTKRRPQAPLPQSVRWTAP